MESHYRFNPPRKLTFRERELTTWVIQNGDASAQDKEKFLRPLDTAMVVARCPCGCASVDFAIGGKEPSEVGLTILGDFLCTESDQTNGIFVFARDDLLAGIEIYQLNDEKIREELPSPELLRPLGETFLQK